MFSTKQKFTFKGSIMSPFDFTTDDIVLALVDKNDCPSSQNGVRATTIHIGKLLAKGVNGKIWEVFVEGHGEKPYVVKVTNANTESEFVEKRLSLDAIAKSFEKTFGYPYKLTVALNGGNPDEIMEVGDSICIAPHVRPCKTKEKVTYLKADGSGSTITIPMGSSLCDKTYSEYYIGLLCGKLYRGIALHQNTRVNCVNFVDVFGFAQCARFCELKQYSFMQKLHGNIKTMPPMNRDVYDSLYAQFIMAANVMQSSYEIVHGDLRSEHFLIEMIKPGSLYNGHDLYDAEYLEYRFGTKSYYIKNMGLILKIGGFGLSVKYSKPLVGFEYVLQTGAKFEGTPMLPNWFSPSYDVVVGTASLYDEFEINDGLVDRMYAHITSEYGGKIPTTKYGRPRLSALTELDKFASPGRILQTPEFDKLRTRPHSRNIALVGEIAERKEEQKKTSWW